MTRLAGGGNAALSMPVGPDGRMTQPITTPHEMPSPLRPARSVAPAIVVGGAILGTVLLSGALLLWFHYGTAVFFEMITSGIAACF
jgi:hypothetical protein